MSILANHGMIGNANQVRYINSGAAVAVASGTTLNVPLPPIMPIGGVMLLQLAIGALTPQITGDPTGWGTLFNDTDASFIRQYVLRHYINGSESGDVPIVFGSAISNVAIAQIHVFVNEKTTLPFDESGGLVIGNQTYSPASITTTKPHSLAVSFVYLPGNFVLGPYTGNTGGKWASNANSSTTLGSDATIQLQTAELPAPGTISGGSYAAGVGGLSLTRSFSIMTP